MIILFEFETLHIIQHSVRYEFYHVTKDGFYDNHNCVETIIFFKIIFEKFSFVPIEEKKTIFDDIIKGNIISKSNQKGSQKFNH